MQIRNAAEPDSHVRRDLTNSLCELASEKSSIFKARSAQLGQQRHSGKTSYFHHPMSIELLFQDQSGILCLMDVENELIPANLRSRHFPLAKLYDVAQQIQGRKARRLPAKEPRAHNLPHSLRRGRPVKPASVSSDANRFRNQANATPQAYDHDEIYEIVSRILSRSHRICNCFPPLVSATLGGLQQPKLDSSANSSAYAPLP